MAGENEEFNDLPNLGQDGTGDNKPDPVGEQGDALDKLLDEHIKETNRDDGAGDRRAPAGGKKEGEEEEEGTQGARGATGADGRQQGTRQQQQGDARNLPRGSGTQSSKQLGSMFKTGPDGSVYDQAGNKIANSGLERRVAERVARAYQGIETEHAAFKQRIEAIESANGAAKAAGLSIEEQAMGLRLASAWKKDQVGTINFLLNQAQQAGIDVSAIRSGGVDPSALAQVVEDKIKAAFEPFQVFIQRANAERENAELTDAVQEQIVTFFEQFPDAEQHRQVIGAIMHHTGDNPKEAWFRLSASAAQNGWDLSKPLPAQAQNGTRRAAPTGGGNSRTIPAMNGRAAAGSGNGRMVRQGSLDSASADASWDDIVADALGTQQ